MVTLPEITSYSAEQLKRLGDYSPISKHYLQLLEKKTLNQSDRIRLTKHQHWLKCALATLCSDFTPEHICKYWSDQTDKIIQDLWLEIGLPEEDVSLIAFGKLGSRELNLSSDIDIVFVKNNAYENENLIPLIRSFIRLLSESTLFGFAYRVDLNLRPGGEHSPLIPSKEHFYNFYDEYLEAWHRLSFIRARALNKPSKLDNSIISYCKKRCFPKRLDFSVIDEIKSIRSKINLRWQRDKEPLDIKLHPGGIRDIELYIHSLQVIYGGRNKEAQVPGITQAINNLTNIGAISVNESQFLLDFYWKLRKLENLIHIKNDRHTYLVQDSDLEELKRYGFDFGDLTISLQKSQGMIADFFIQPTNKSSLDHVSTKNMGEGSQKAIQEIINLQSRSIKKQKVDFLKNEILDLYIQKTHEIAIDQDLAIQIFRDFIFAIKSKSTIFHVLSRHHELLEQLAWLFSVSPFAGQLLTRRPELIDSFVLGQVAIDNSDELETLWENLVDYKLLGQLTALVSLLQTRDLETYLQSISDQADFIVTLLQTKLQEKFQTKPLEILCMGKWSGKELGVRSDLDFLFVSDQVATPAQLKMARRLINLITMQSPAGRLYEIDLRLKPNESAGPLIIEKQRLLEFLDAKAEPWQKQAYLRSRIINTDSFFLKDQFGKVQLKEQDVLSLNEILDRLLTKPTDEKFDIKSSVGGLIHSEFVIQKLCLLKGRPPARTDFASIVESLDLKMETGSALISNYRELRLFEQVFQICMESSSTKVSINNENLVRVGKILGIQDTFKAIEGLLREQRDLLKSLDLNP